jgi:hypothetical protein
MANIPQYDAPNLALRPSETGVEAVAGTARRVGMFYNQQSSAEETLARETERLAGQTQQLGRETGEFGSEKGAALTSVGRAVGSGVEAVGDAAVKYLDHQQISKGSADFTQLMLGATKQWNDTVKNADPNDPTVGPKFMAALNSQLDSFKQNGGFVTDNGQQWAEAHIDALRQHMAEKTQGDMSSLAGEAAVVNHQQTINQLSATVHSDPSSIDFALATLKSSSEGVISTSPNLTGAEAGKVRMELQQHGAEAIVKSAAVGYIEKTGNMPDWITDPKYAPYVNGAELKMLESAAQTETKKNALVDKQTALAQRQLGDLNVHQGATKVISDNVTFDPQTHEPIISPKFFQQALDIARKNPDAPSAAETVRTMFSWGESQQNKEAKAVDDPATRQALTDKLFDPSKPTTVLDLMKARADGKLSDHSFSAMKETVEALQNEPLKGEIWKTTIAAVKDRLIDPLQIKDTVGSANYASFMQDFIPQYLAKQRTGTLQPNALNLNDPNSMISQSLQPYKSSMQDKLKAAPAEPEKSAVSETPANLRGIASLSYSKSRNVYRDDASGKIYKPDGTEVGK